MSLDCAAVSVCLVELHGWHAGKQDVAVQLKTLSNGAGSGEVRLSLTEEEDQEDAEGQSLLSQQQQKSDEPEPVKSKVPMTLSANVLRAGCCCLLA